MQNIEKMYDGRETYDNHNVITSDHQRNGKNARPRNHLCSTVVCFDLDQVGLDQIGTSKSIIEGAFQAFQDFQPNDLPIFNIVCINILLM